jgi:hypothetical protein
MVFTDFAGGWKAYLKNSGQCASERRKNQPIQLIWGRLAGASCATEILGAGWAARFLKDGGFYGAIFLKIRDGGIDGAFAGRL